MITPKDKSPIYFINATGEIRERVGSKKCITFTARKIVVKGTPAEIEKSEDTKKQFIRGYFKGDSGAVKKAFNFDLNKITILRIEIIRSLGYGIKSN